jgi:hypothetical protein
MTPVGYVQLLCDDPPLNISVLLGEGAPRYTGGFGGWDTTDRPQQVAMTTWNGSDPLALELPVVLDGFSAGASQEDALRALYAVARGDDQSPPGVVQVAGLVLAADRWVISGLDVSDAILADDGSHLRAAITLTLTEFVPPTFVQLRRGALAPAKGKTKVVTVKHGDTPAKVAHRNHCQWTVLRQLNPAVVRKANQKLTAGSKLRVPVHATRAHKAKGGTRSRKGHSSTSSN